MIFRLDCGLFVELSKDFTAKIINSQQVKGDICIPRIINFQSQEYLITAIDKCAFKHNTFVKSISFADNSEITYIGDEAFSSSSVSIFKFPSYVKHIGCRVFYGCLSLKTIIFPENSELLTISNGAFSYSSLESIFLPKKITKIESNAFTECKSLTTIGIPENSELKTIEKDAFVSSSLEKIFLPSKVEELKEGWCNGTSKLIDIRVSPKNIFYSNYEKIVLGKTEKNKSDFDSIVFANRDITKAVIPSSIKYIYSNSFSKCRNLQSIEISENSNLISIGDEAFFDSCLKSIFIPKNVKKIKKSSFYGCNRLKEITFHVDSELSAIEKEAFTFASFKKISIPFHVTRIEDRAFANCYNLKEVNIPDNSELQSIGKSAFFCAPFESLWIPSNLDDLNEGWCCGTSKLINVKVSLENKNYSIFDEKIILGKTDKSLNFFDSIVFACRDIAKVTIPSSIKYIYSYSFSSCKKLQKIEFQNDSKLVSINKYAFSYSSLEAISLPQSTKLIDDYAFSFCSNFKAVEFLADDLFFGICSFEDCRSLSIISLPNAQKISITNSSFSAQLINPILFIYSNAKIIKINK